MSSLSRNIINFDPLMELHRANRHLVLLKEAPDVVKMSLADHHLELGGANLLAAVGADSLKVFPVGHSDLCFLMNLMEVMNKFPDLRGTQLSFAIDEFYLELDIDLVKLYIQLIFRFEGAFPKASMVFNLPIESRIWVKILGISEA